MMNIDREVLCSRCGKYWPKDYVISLICFDDEADVCGHCTEPNDKPYADIRDWNRQAALKVVEEKL
jgi:hypothetical protein